MFVQRHRNVKDSLVHRLRRLALCYWQLHNNKLPTYSYVLSTYLTLGLLNAALAIYFTLLRIFRLCISMNRYLHFLHGMSYYYSVLLCMLFTSNLILVVKTYIHEYLRESLMIRREL